ncbi:MAG: hypothetical protein JNL70_13040 [Saprospiraceae bacterium]|nr:hypothetical protein [Saprospiraceae bacterium]
MPKCISKNEFEAAKAKYLETVKMVQNPCTQQVKLDFFIRLIVHRAAKQAVKDMGLNIEILNLL